MQSKTKRTAGMTLIEVLVALTVASFVFSSLLQMTFDALKRAKLLELQDKMRNYATDVIQVVYDAKDTDWVNTFGTNAMIPPAATNAPVTQLPMGYLDVTNPTGKPKLTALTYDVCHFDATNGILSGSDCARTAANEVDSATSPKLFGRIVIRTDDNVKGTYENQDTINDATIEVVVACIESKCDSTEFKPYILNFQVYRTSGP